MYNLVKSLVFKFCLIFFIISCNKSSSNIDQAKLAKISQTIEYFNGNYLEGRIFEGEVIVNKTKESSLLIAVKSTQNNNISDLLTFAYQDSLQYEFPEFKNSLGKSKIYLFKDGGVALIFNLQNNKGYIFSLDESIYQKRIATISQKLKEIDFTVNNYKGYQIGVGHGNWDEKMAVDKENNGNLFQLFKAYSKSSAVNSSKQVATEAELAAQCAPGYKAYLCNSGGYGASSCSTTGCSVTCINGFNACCHTGFETFCACTQTFVEKKYGCFPF